MKVSLRLTVTLNILIYFLLVLSSCTEQVPETPSPVAENFAVQIAAINLNSTTSLTRLFQFSYKLDQAQGEGSLYEGEWAKLHAELMAKFTDWVNTREERLGLGNLPPVPTGNITWPVEDLSLLDSAAERIKQYRQGNATILLVDSAGAPVADAVVRLDMLKHNFLFGAGVWSFVSYPTPDFSNAFTTLFNYVTLAFCWAQEGWEQRWPYDMANWAKTYGIKTLGHPLVFPSYSYCVPDWATQLSLEELDDVLYRRVTRIVSYFRGLIDCWVVVNEPLNVGQEPMKGWMLAYTPAGATARALKWARSSNQEATLLVNETSYNFQKYDDYHALLEDVLASGAQFDAIGLQSHMHTGTWTLQQVWDICERFKDFNLPLQFTEVTVLSGDLKTDDDWWSYHPGWDTTPEGEAIQAEYVPAFYTILFSHPSMEAITWNCLSDLDAWQGAPAGLIRKDMSPKPAYEQLMRLINKEWWTNAEATTNEQGKALTRGFYGQYLLTIESGTQKIQTLIHLEAGQSNTFEVRLP